MDYILLTSTGGISMDDIFATAKNPAQSNGYDYYAITSQPNFAFLAATANAGYYNSVDQIHLSDSGEQAVWGGLKSFLTTSSYNWYNFTLSAPLGSN